MDGKSCYTYKGVAYIGFDNEEKMNTALQIPITYNNIALTAKVKGAAYIRKPEPYQSTNSPQFMPTTDYKHSPTPSSSYNKKGKNKCTDTMSEQSTQSSINSIPTSHPDKLNMIIQQLQELHQLHHKVSQMSSVYDQILSQGLLNARS